MNSVESHRYELPRDVQRVCDLGVRTFLDIP